jgi:hypothetical protein
MMGSTVADSLGLFAGFEEGWFIAGIPLKARLRHRENRGA